MGLLDKLPAAQLHMVSKACGDPTAHDTNTLPNSQLDPQQADQFIDLLVDESRLLSLVDVIRTNRCSGKVHSLDLCSVVTEGACTTSCPTGTVPQEFVRDWKVEKYRAFQKVTEDHLECNLEGQNYKARMLSMFEKRMRMDLEIAAIMGDNTLNTGDNQPRINNLLGVNDGWRKILANCVPDCQVIDAQGQSPNRFLYHAIRRRIPTRYRNMLSEYRLLGPPAMADQWVLESSLRETGMGDAAICNGVASCAPWGIPMETIPLFYENIPYTPEGALSPIDTFDIWLIPPKNLKVYVSRDMRFEEVRDPRNDAYDIYVHYKVDFEVANTDVPVLVKNVSLCGQPYSCDCETTCPSCP